MNINLSQLSKKGKKKIIRERLHRFNWTKVSEDSEWICASIESEKGIVFFTQWISKQLIYYPVEVILFDHQWDEISNSLSLNESDILSLFKMRNAAYIISNNMKWLVEYSNNIQVARFGTIDI